MTGHEHRDLTNIVGEWELGIVNHSPRYAGDPYVPHGAASDAAHAMRAMCHLLVNGGYLPAATAYTIAGDMSTLLHRTAEALPSAAHALERSGEVPGLALRTTNPDRDATTQLNAATHALMLAAEHAANAARWAQAAQQALADLYHEATTRPEAAE